MFKRPNVCCYGIQDYFLGLLEIAGSTDLHHHQLGVPVHGEGAHAALQRDLEAQNEPLVLCSVVGRAPEVRRAGCDGAPVWHAEHCRTAATGTRIPAGPAIEELQPSRCQYLWPVSSNSTCRAQCMH